MLFGGMEYPEPMDEALPPGHLELCTSASGMTTSQSESESESESESCLPSEIRAAGWDTADRRKFVLAARCGVMAWRHGGFGL